MQHDTRIPIAVGNACRAAIANERNLIAVPHGAHPLSPGVATPYIEIPVYVKALVSPIADEVLRFAPQMTLHVGD